MDIKNRFNEKYSHKANLEEIKENKFNLNIPRYVDTFEKEKSIDINQAADKLKDLNKEKVAIQKRSLSFVKN